MGPIEIRRMTPEDGESVFALMREFYDSPAVLVDTPDPILRRDIADAVSDNPFLDGFIFTEEENIVGYAMTTRCYSTEYGGLAVGVEDLFLLPAYRGRGLATRFFAHIEELYPEAVRFKLEVERDNVPAMASYRKNGYAVSDYVEMTKEMPLRA